MLFSCQVKYYVAHLHRVICSVMQKPICPFHVKAVFFFQSSHRWRQKCGMWHIALMHATCCFISIFMPIMVIIRNNIVPWSVKAISKTSWACCWECAAKVAGLSETVWTLRHDGNVFQTLWITHLSVWYACCFILESWMVMHKMTMNRSSPVKSCLYSQKTLLTQTVKCTWK